MKYFISDHHWGHKAIIHMESRPFDNVWEMNQFMIDSWNSVITEEDEVYHLGDVSYKMNLNQLKTVLSELNGKIHLIRGNHDKDKVIAKVGSRFETIQDYKYFQYKYEDKEYNFVLFHYPIYSWQGRFRGSIHLHGHTHKTDFDDTTGKGFYGHIMNVAVEHLNYKPISIVDIINRFKNITLEKV